MRNIENGLYKGVRAFVIDVVEVDARNALDAFLAGDRKWAQQQQPAIIRAGTVFDNDVNEEVKVFEVIDEVGGRTWIEASKPLIRLMIPVQLGKIE